MNLLLSVHVVLRRSGRLAIRGAAVRAPNPVVLRTPLAGTSTIRSRAYAAVAQGREQQRSSRADENVMRGSGPASRPPETVPVGVQPTHGHWGGARMRVS